MKDIIGKLLINKKLTIGVAESCTGGLVSSFLTDVSGSSAYTCLNVVTYSNEAKIRILNVPQDILDKHGAVSEKTAHLMAKGILNLAQTDIGLGITGVAGPTGGTNQKPVGLVYIGICNNKYFEVYKHLSDSTLSREEIKLAYANKALSVIKDFIKNYY